MDQYAGIDKGIVPFPKVNVPVSTVKMSLECAGECGSLVSFKCRISLTAQAFVCTWYEYVLMYHNIRINK